MIKVVLAIVAVFVSMIFVPTDAYASFDLWDINEIYSNADGTLQFIELTTLANGEQFVTGHTITSNSDGTVNTFTLINNTPSPTANRTILFATSSLASVPDFPVPDFIILNNFFNPTANTITLNYGESSDIVTLTSGQLPTDGLQSSDDNGNSQLASPTNFNGDTGIPPFESPDTFQISIPPNSSNPNCSQIKNLCYSPDFLTVGMGDIVTWTNNDGTAHTTISTGELSWDSGTISPGGEFSFSMTVVGTHEYLCTIHPWMTGTIKVVDPGAISVPSGASLAGNCDSPNTCFNPELITVGIGDIVTWTNNDNIEHTITSGIPSDGPDGLWDSGNLSTGEVFSIIAPSPAGSYNYFCTIHPWQTGTLDVVDLTSNPILPVIPKGSITIDLELVASDLVAPVHLTHAGDGTGRLFVVDQPGQIRIIDNTGTLLEQPFLDITSDIITLGFFGSFDENDFDERGLLGLAFHPQFTNSTDPGFRKVYTFSSEPVSGPADFTVSLPEGAIFDNQNVITEWTVDESNPNLIDTSTKREVMRIDEPQFNHQGGMLAFGPDGYLYISLGDGGDADDTGDGHGTIGNGQDGSTILGTIVRIDPIRPSDTPLSSDNVSANGAYRIPNTNPFLLDSNILDEIYALGLRNPFRFSFDTMTGDLIVADVGQNLIEEINVIQVGGNYGWNFKEGTFAFDSAASPVSISFDLEGLVGELIDPVVQYDHTEGISIIGGFVYRGSAIPELDGQYVFGDFSLGFFVPNGRIFYVNLNDGQINEFILAADDLPLNTFVKSTGQDESGELYFLVGQNLGPFKTSTGQSLGQVLKIIPFTQTTVSGTVFADTNDNGIQDGGETGIAGLTVVLVDGDGTLAPSATTNTNGAYSFSDVAPGTILVQVAPVPTLHLPATGFTSFATPTITSGQSLTQDFPLVPVTVPATVTGTVFADTNNNGVQDPGELGLEGVTVFVVDFLTLTQILPNPVTDANGVYTANGVLPDNVLVQAAPIPDGFLPSIGFNTFAFPALVPGANTVNFALAPVAPADEGTITIDVFADANSNGVKDAGESGVEGATVFTFELLNAVADVQITDATGTTTHTGLIPDVVLAQINAVVLPPGFTTITTTNTVPGAEFVTLTPGASETVQIGLFPELVVLPPNPPIIIIPTTNSSYFVNGVIPITGTSDADAFIELFLDEVLVLSTTADSAGNWSFSNFSISTIGSHDIAVDATVSGSTVEGDSITLFIVTGGGGY